MDSNPQPKPARKINNSNTMTKGSRPMSGGSGNVSGSDGEIDSKAKYGKNRTMGSGSKKEKRVTIQADSKYGKMPQRLHDDST